MNMYLGIMHVPWTLKIFYGLLSDNVPLFGTHRKSYIVGMGCLQFLTLLLTFFLHNTSALTVTILLTIANLSEAFVNVMADALLCIQARRDPRDGSQNLIALSFMSNGFGGVVGGITGGLMT